MRYARNDPSLLPKKSPPQSVREEQLSLRFIPVLPAPLKFGELIDTARHAPNHHRTEPARFYLLDAIRIQKVGQLFGEVIRAEGPDDSLIKKAQKKSKEWGAAPGLIVVTCHSDPSFILAQKILTYSRRITPRSHAFARIYCFS